MKTKSDISAGTGRRIGMLKTYYYRNVFTPKSLEMSSHFDIDTCITFSLILFNVFTTVAFY